MVYKYPSSLLKQTQAWMRKFIWSGSITANKLIVVSWKNVYKSKEDGGLGLRRLDCLNKAAMLKQA